MLYRWQEVRGPEPLPAGDVRRALGVGRPSLALALAGLRLGGRVRRENGGFVLEEAGQQHAAGLIRGHRLWEAYLAHVLGLPETELHEPAMRLEHYLGPDLQRELADRLEHPEADPHGRKIPAPAAADTEKDGP